MKKLLTITYILSAILVNMINLSDNEVYKVTEDPYKVSVLHMDPGGTN